MKYVWGCLLCILWISACLPSRTATISKTKSDDADVLEERFLDTLVVTPETGTVSPIVANSSPQYHHSAKREIDIIHTQLDLRFNWEEEAVIGKAVLHLTPYAHAIVKFNLDARDFKIQSVSFSDRAIQPQYRYDGKKIFFDLSTPILKNDTVSLSIEYEAYPSEGSEGSLAITSDKGLFFINPRLTIPGKPQQIWTQGETEFNSKWFPTVDKPNERTTQETILTVSDKFQTLSNGLLYKSVSNPDGTRTDYWRMDQPHAPYLFMVAIGEFAVVEETWEEIPLQYYVEQPYAADAKTIFAHTPEMLSFFSNITGIKYPWSKYAQIVVRDYVSGAMENTTGVIFGDFVQKHQRELIDQSNDGIVAHEMFHHWFGNYVTCESWSNLTLNEGFANYSEYLWFEHKYGVDEADHHRRQELQGYLYEASNRIHPLIDFSYDDKESMFDQHSYNKGGLVLHMLRKYVGDGIFFAALHQYLSDNAYGAVEVHDLRLAFEKTCGEDLNWFFNQWFLSSGHPVLTVNDVWSEATSTLSLEIEQIQDPGKVPLIFILPIEIAIIDERNQIERIKVTIDQRKQMIEIPLTTKPSLVLVDPDDDLLAIIQQDFTQAELRTMFLAVETLAHRTKAFRLLSLSSSGEDVEIASRALNDRHWSVREKAITKINWTNADPVLKDILLKMARFDPHSVVRSEAILALSEWNDPMNTGIFLAGINNQDAYPVVSASILSLYETDPQTCLDQIKKLHNEKNDAIVSSISMVYGSEKDPVYLHYFEKHLATVDGYAGLDFYEDFELLLSGLDFNDQLPWIQKCETVALDPENTIFARLGATRTVINIFKHYKGKQTESAVSFSDSLNTIVQNILSQEKSSQLKNIYLSLLDS